MFLFLKILSSLFFLLISSVPLQAEGGGEKKDKDEDDSEKKSKKEGENKEGSTTEDSVFRSYLNVGDMTVPVIKHDGVFAYIKMKVQIMTKDGSSIEPFRPYKKRLFDAHFSDVYSVMSDRWLPSKDPTSEAIQKRLAKQTDRIVGSDKLLTILPMFYFYKVPEKPKK